MVCGTVQAPRREEVVRLFVRDFNARFGSGASFVVCEQMRFTHKAAARHAGAAAARSTEASVLEEIWMRVSAGGAVAQHGDKEKGSSRAEEGRGRGQRLVVEGDVMRNEGRRWVRVHREDLADRLVTEALPLSDADAGESGFVHLFCTSLLTLPPRDKELSSDWVEAWGGDTIGVDANGAPRPVVLRQVERQWIWEIRSVAHCAVAIPPAPPARLGEMGALDMSAALDLAAAARSGGAGVVEAGGGSGGEVGDGDGGGDGAQGENAGWDVDSYCVSVSLERPFTLWGSDRAGCVSVRTRDICILSGHAISVYK